MALQQAGMVAAQPAWTETVAVVLVVGAGPRPQVVPAALPKVRMLQTARLAPQARAAMAVAAMVETILLAVAGAVVATTAEMRPE